MTGGVYNAIANGGDQPGIWRTLSNSEWGYLIYTRSGASYRYGIGTVCGIHCLIILPDAWSQPTGCSFTPGVSNTHEPADWTLNEYTSDQWQLMEAPGAVALPSAGRRHGTDWDEAFSQVGRYWSSTKYSSEYKACYFGFDATHVSPGHGIYLSYGLAVRLVQDAN